MPQPVTVMIFVGAQESLRHRTFFCGADLSCFIDHAQTRVGSAMRLVA